ncbi:MAG: Na/Pi cotransporter family protein [Clostridia bacterium]
MNDINTIISNIMLLFAGIGVFMVAIHMTSESMEKIASDKLRKLLNKVSGNKLMGVGIGAGVTALIQSSSATTVMVVGMVNAGIMTLAQAVNIIMGANIGTTITGLLSALPTMSGTTSFPITDIFMLLSFMGIIINIISKSDRIKTWGTFLAGLGSIFVGLKCMSISMEFMRDLPAFRDAITMLSNPFLLLILGAAFTGIIQSSAAVTGILITMAGQGAIIGGGGNAMLYIILGTNIGTCVTAMLASIGTSANGKRASIIHLMFNVIGSVIFFVILWAFPSFYDVVMKGIFGNNNGLIIAVFHVVFNLVNTIIMLPFANWLVKISTFLVKEKKKAGKYSLQYIDDRILKTPSIALDQLLKEVARLAQVSRKTLKLSVEAFLEGKSTLQYQVKDTMEEINYLMQEITKYLIKLNGYDLSSRDEITASSLHYIISDFERIADLGTNIMRYTVNAQNKNLTFSNAINKEVMSMYEAIDRMYELTLKGFYKRNNAFKREINIIEDEVDSLRTQNLENHIQRMNKGECNPESGGIYVNTINNLERAADHLVFIAERPI